MQTMLTICYQGLRSLHVMLTVLWFGAANSRPRLLYQLPKQNILQCLMLFGTQFQFKILSKRLAVFFFCRTLLQTFASWFMKTTFLLYQWQNHWNSLLVQHVLQFNIITFAAEFWHPSTNQATSNLSTHQQSSKLLISLPNQLMMTASASFAICYVDGDINSSSFPRESENNAHMQWFLKL